MSVTSSWPSSSETEKNVQESEVKSKLRRTRTNLKNLSDEDKRLRRLTQDRVAAQSSRKRKKERQQRMEAKVKVLSEERTRLAEEVDRMRSWEERLQRENVALKEQLEAQLLVERQVLVKRFLTSLRLNDDQITDDLSSRDCCSQIDRDALLSDPSTAPFLGWLVVIDYTLRSTNDWVSALRNFSQENSAPMPSEIFDMVLFILKSQSVAPFHSDTDVFDDEFDTN